MSQAISNDEFLAEATLESGLLACSTIKGGPVNPLDKLEVVYEIVFDKGQPQPQDSRV